MEPSSFSGSSRRARPPANIAQVAHCLVDGCLADLSLCKDYHRRHKVCEIHSKTPKVSIRGREQRFCQQCSRFHSLVEFDGEKKSCRKRLDGHNRRRRKTQPDSLTRNLGLDFSNQQGTTLLSFSTPQILPSAVVGFSWAGVVKTEHDMGPLCNNQQQQQLNYMETPNSSCPSQSSYKGVNHLELIQGSEMYSDGLNQVVDSDGALSLLSSASPVTREFSLNNVLRAEPLPRTSSLVNNMQYGGLGHLYQLAQDSKQAVVTSSDSHGTDAGSTLQFGEMFQHGAEGSSSSGSHQTLTFMWE